MSEWDGERIVVVDHSDEGEVNKDTNNPWTLVVCWTLLFSYLFLQLHLLLPFSSTCIILLFHLDCELFNLPFNLGELTLHLWVFNESWWVIELLNSWLNLCFPAFKGLNFRVDRRDIRLIWDGLKLGQVPAISPSNDILLYEANHYGENFHHLWISILYLNQYSITLHPLWTGSRCYSHYMGTHQAGLLLAMIPLVLPQSAS